MIIVLGACMCIYIYILLIVSYSEINSKKFVHNSYITFVTTRKMNNHDRIWKIE